MTRHSVPQKGSYAFRAAEFIRQNGPVDIERLWRGVRQVRSSKKDFVEAIKTAVDRNWLTYLDDGLIDNSTFSAMCVADAPVKYQGEIVPPAQINKLHRPEYRWNLSLTGLRPASDPVPEWSIREPRFISLAGGAE